MSEKLSEKEIIEANGGSSTRKNLSDNDIETLKNTISNFVWDCLSGVKYKVSDELNKLLNKLIQEDLPLNICIMRLTQKYHELVSGKW